MRQKKANEKGTNIDQKENENEHIKMKENEKRN